MAIPTRHRAALKADCDGQLVVTVDPSNCLLVFPLPVWGGARATFDQASRA